MSHPAFCGLSRQHLGELVAELAPRRVARCESGGQRPGRMHDQTALRTEGIAEQFHQHPGVRAEADDGYRGLANEFPDQVSAPPRKPKDMKVPNEGPVTERYGWREMKRRQSSRRICVEHANAEVRRWRPLQRYTGRREAYGETHLAIAALVSARAAKRPTRHKPSTELVHVRTTAC
ncbi:transposase family protein [Streptomyces prasinus]|uniref:transposase family protein n=1 Tax=Streptomyces prasinus TaxID=67345 RepID=UPI0036309890